MSKTEQPFNYTTASGISIVAVSLLILHVFWVKFTVDTTGLALIGLAALPWLTLFVKKLKLPGGLEAETSDRVQSTTKSPPPPSNVSSELEGDSSELPPEAKKILATLGRYQKQHFQNNQENRWTFTVSPTVNLYEHYLKGITYLYSRGLITIGHNHHIMLTNEGLDYVKRHSDILNNQDIYRF